MQVHKEAIDKVPNSLPNRSNIEIEIYGMEGIPPEDIREHEKQKSGIKTFFFTWTVGLWIHLYVPFTFSQFYYVRNTVAVYNRCYRCVVEFSVFWQTNHY